MTERTDTRLMLLCMAANILFWAATGGGLVALGMWIHGGAP